MEVVKEKRLALASTKFVYAGEPIDSREGTCTSWRWRRVSGKEFPLFLYLP